MLCKKRFSVAILICVVLVLSMGSPMAAVSQQPLTDSLISSGINPSPMLVYIHRAVTSLSISTSGLAVATGSLSGYIGETGEVWIYLYLEQYVNGTWVTYDSWSGFYQSYKGVLSGSCYVPRGYAYRVRGTYYAWSGNNYERMTANTDVRYY